MHDTAVKQPSLTQNRKRRPTAIDTVRPARSKNVLRHRAPAVSCCNTLLAMNTL